MEGLVTSPTQLQQLADLSEAPKMQVTTKTSWNAKEDDPSGDLIKICDLSMDEVKSLRKKAVLVEYDCDANVWFQGGHRSAILIKEVKEDSLPETDS